MMKVTLALLTVVLLFPGAALAQYDGRGNGSNGSNGCNDLPGYGKLKAALEVAVAVETSGLNLQMWATIVDRDGIVCAVAFSGVNRGAQWPGSRVISAQKANTANAFSLDDSSARGGSSGAAGGLALSTANLYSAVQPGGSLFGLQESNPVNVQAAYRGPSNDFGKFNDPLVGEKVGGVNVFGGGLALYGPGKEILGGVGVSGDTSCADHNIAWRVRRRLELDHLSGVGGVSGDAARPDNIIYDIVENPDGGTGKSAGGFGHPKCINTGDPSALPPVHP
ncbi:MAG TPA: heme-binding protein [Terriglobia bacterium]|nr:heme-binding protein [Terriglobia bacterium]